MEESKRKHLKSVQHKQKRVYENFELKFNVKALINVSTTIFIFLLSTLSLSFSLNFSKNSLDVDLDLIYHVKDTIFSLYNTTVDNFININIGITYKNERFSFISSISITNDKLYYDQLSDEFYGGFYFKFKEELIKFRFNDSTISFGKSNLGDTVLSPYSLFISSINYPRNLLEYRYDDGTFLYITRWIELNNLKNASINYEKYRGANYKVYAVKNNGVRFGYEEINVYVGRNFDFEYFANPAPGFFIQYLNDSDHPYQEGIGESNFLMGFFIDYADKEKYIYAQVLIDDINMNRFLNPQSYQNPDKIAWSFGASFKNYYGKLSLYHAGATKYTFQPTVEWGQRAYYGYTYFPYLTYQRASERLIFPPELLYGGYKYGENNIAFLLEYEPKEFFGVKPAEDEEIAKFSCEYVVLGERSPVNPWNERSTFPENTHLLDEPVLEHRLLASANINFNRQTFSMINSMLSLTFNTTIGYIWNKSELVEVTSDNSKKPFLRPKDGNNAPYFSISIGFNFKVSF